MQYIADAQMRWATGWGLTGHESWILLNDHPGPLLSWARTLAVGLASLADPYFSSVAVVASMAVVVIVGYSAGVWALGFGLANWRGALLGAVSVSAVVALSFSFPDSRTLVDHWSLVSGGWAVAPANALVFSAVCLAVASTVRPSVSAVSLPLSALTLHVYLPYVPIAAACLAISAVGAWRLCRSGRYATFAVSVLATLLASAPLGLRVLQEGWLFWLPRRFPVLEQEQPWTLHVSAHLMLPPAVGLLAYALVIGLCMFAACLRGSRRRTMLLSIAALVTVTGASQAVLSGGGLVHQFAWVEAVVVVAGCMLVGWLLRDVPLWVVAAGSLAAVLCLTAVSLQRPAWDSLTTSGASEEMLASYEAAWYAIDEHGGAVDVQGFGGVGATLLFYFPGMCVAPNGFTAYAFAERLCPPSRPVTLMVSRLEDAPPERALRPLVEFGTGDDEFLLWEVDPPRDS